MRGRIVRIVLWSGLLALSSCALFSRERWVYLYSGRGRSMDTASSIVMGSDGNLYAAGSSKGNGIGNDFTVVSLTPSGALRWIYRYGGSTGAWGARARSIIGGSDGYLYAAGESWGNGTRGDFTVVSLTESGEERWVYRYNGTEYGQDLAWSIAMGPDGDLYAAGRSDGNGTGPDFVVVSLTASGEKRWVYRYSGTEDGLDEAVSVIVGSDGCVYAAGGSKGNGTAYDLTVVSLTDSGVECWVYRYDGPECGDDWAVSLAMGSDGNLYAAGLSSGEGTFSDFTVVSLTPSGVERWVYRYNGSADSADWASSVLVGPDGNVYAAGYISGSRTSRDLAVVSLTASGEERWVYRYDGPGNTDDCAHAIAMGSDGNLYAAGESDKKYSWPDFTVLSLTTSGVERWVYRYDGTGRGGGDAANSVIMGRDGKVYAAGSSIGRWTYDDLTVVSLNP